MDDITRYKHEVFKCTKTTCNFICYTVNQLQEHTLDRHSTLVVPTYTVNGVEHGKTLCEKDIHDEHT